MAMIHHETMQVKQKEWENEVQLHQRHQVTAHQLFDLTQASLDQSAGDASERNCFC